MMIRIKVSIAILICLLKSSFLSGETDAEYFNMKGQVTFVYENLGNSYFLKKSTYASHSGKEYQFLKNCASLNRIQEFCNDEETLIKAVDKCQKQEITEGDLFFSPHFRKQYKDSVPPENMIHKGGDIYNFEKDKNSLIVSFNIEGTGIMFNRVCSSYLNWDKKLIDHCPFEIPLLSPPFIVNLTVEETSSLTSTQIKKRGLIPYEKDKFYLTVCE